MSDDYWFRGDPKGLGSRAILDRDACSGCGREIVKVDLHGSPFFEHKPRPDCLTWWHVDESRNLSHQARPLRTGVER